MIKIKKLMITTFIMIIILTIFYLFIIKNKTLSSCQINNIEIPKGFIGTTAVEVISILGKPSAQDMGIKFFQEYTYSFENKLFYAVIRYNEEHKVVDAKCKIGKARLIIGEYVIIH